MANDFAQGFTTLEPEVVLESLPAQGQIPEWLSGTLVRNGPEMFAVGEQPFRHWFDGQAMLHRFSFAGGRVGYANKYLQSPSYKKNLEAGKISYPEFATDPCRSIFQRVATLFSPGPAGHNANVNITRLANRFLAMTETPLPVEFDPDTLATAGVVEFEDEIGFGATTAHPHYDPGRQVGVNQIIKYGRQSTYNVYFVNQQLERKIVGSVAADKPGYMHSFGMTENYVILVEFPLLVNPMRLLLSGKPFIENFVWEPEHGVRFFVLAKDDGRLLSTFDSDAFFAFHHINAYEHGGDIVVDISAYEDDSLVQELYLNNLRDPEGVRLSFPEFRRYRLPEGGGRASYELLSEEAIELPRINYGRHNGRDYQFAYGVSFRREGRDDFLNQLVKVDVISKQTTVWTEDSCYPGEPVFVAAPEAEAEDEGLVLSVVLDGDRGTSFLLVLDAGSFKEVARAEVPHHIPFGFHGQYFGP